MRFLRLAFLLTALLLATVPVAADAPFVQGGIAGIELCPQSICGVAIFVGEFEGSIDGGLPRHGIFLAGINHEPELPDEDGESIAITGGSFVIRLPFRTPIRGVVDRVGGTLTKNENEETFAVAMPLHVLSPDGLVAGTFLGTLSHEVFPPTIVGPLVTID